MSEEADPAADVSVNIGKLASGCCGASPALMRKLGNYYGGRHILALQCSPSRPGSLLGNA